MRSTCLPEVTTRGERTDLCCDVCGNLRLRRRFSIPLLDGPYQGDKEDKYKTIYQCECCGHLSGMQVDCDKYASYYASLSNDYHCEHDSEQWRYKSILELLPMKTMRRVLDIGCGTGTFLSMLPPEVERFGIEPSRSAANGARAKGVQIIESEDLAKGDLRNTFDIVTAIDVVEHSMDLERFRRDLVSALRPGGTAIILTGDAGSRPAMFLGRYWYYLNFAEHVTVFCANSMRRWLEKDFTEIELTNADHHLLNAAEKLSLTRSWLLFPVKWVFRNILRIRVSKYVVLQLPGDHMVVRAIRNQPVTTEPAGDVD